MMKMNSFIQSYFSPVYAPSFEAAVSSASCFYSSRCAESQDNVGIVCSSLFEFYTDDEKDSPSE